MAWIKTIAPAEADARLRAALDSQQALYPPEYAHGPDDDGSRGVVAAHSLIPAALEHAFKTFGALMSEELPLARRQHELIATRVSALNRCHY